MDDGTDPYAPPESPLGAEQPKRWTLLRGLALTGVILLVLQTLSCNALSQAFGFELQGLREGAKLRDLYEGAALGGLLERYERYFVARSVALGIGAGFLLLRLVRRPLIRPAALLSVGALLLPLVGDPIAGLHSALGIATGVWAGAVLGYWWVAEADARRLGL